MILIFNCFIGNFTECPYQASFGEVFSNLKIARTPVVVPVGHIAADADQADEDELSVRSRDFLSLGGPDAQNVVVKCANDADSYALLWKTPYQLTKKYTSQAQRGANDEAEVIPKGTWVCKIKYLFCINEQNSYYALLATNPNDGQVVSMSSLECIPEAILDEADADSNTFNRSTYMNLISDRLLIEGKQRIVFTFHTDIY